MHNRYLFNASSSSLFSSLEFSGAKTSSSSSGSSIPKLDQTEPVDFSSSPFGSVAAATAAAGTGPTRPAFVPPHDDSLSRYRTTAAGNVNEHGEVSNSSISIGFFYMDFYSRLLFPIQQHGPCRWILQLPLLLPVRAKLSCGSVGLFGSLPWLPHHSV